LELVDAIGKSGGGVIGAVAVLLVGLGLLVAWRVWQAYQKSLESDKEEDRQDKTALRDEVKALREEGKEREGKLLQLVSDGQRIQQETNEILKEVRAEQQAQGKQLATIQGAMEAKRT
jgi:uncharacterized protein HemX